MMPYCEYHRCKKVADTTEMGLLRKWESYHFRDNSNHTQDIALCKKHLKKINKLLQVRELKESTNDKDS